MSSSPPAIPTIRFSTDALPVADRVAMWRELWSRSMLRVDVEPLTDEPFRADLTLRALPNLNVITGVIGASHARRHGELLADGNDDLTLASVVEGTFIVSQRGREVTLQSGDATLASCADEGVFTRPAPAVLFGLRLPRRALISMLPGAEDALMRRVPAANPALKLLFNYAKVFEGDLLSTPELQRTCVSHVYDLLALAFGATGDASELAKKRGLRAVRFHAIKADIESNLLNADLAIAAVARRQNLTPRYIQMLFNDEETTFSEFVLQRRLAHVHRALVDPRMAWLPISTIAFDCGFGDLSHFNRHFRRRYGASPSEVRLNARHGEH